jgi:hypothetical protein
MHASAEVSSSSSWAWTVDEVIRKMIKMTTIHGSFTTFIEYCMISELNKVFSITNIDIFKNLSPLHMKKKQAILEDFGEIANITAKDILGPAQKYIHFWDFMEIDGSVHEFQAKMGLAIEDLKKDMKMRYQSYYTHAVIQTPENFIRHNRELQEIEYLLENPFFLAIVHSALTKNVDDSKLRLLTISYKKRLMERRLSIKETMEKDLSAYNELLIK